MSVISACIKGDMACASAAELLSLSVRHIKRLKKRLREEGEVSRLARTKTTGTQGTERNHLCVPMPFKRSKDADNRTEDEPTDSETRYAFRFRACWFALAQTEGEETYAAPTPRLSPAST